MPNRHIQDILEKQDREVSLAKEQCINLYGPEVTNKYQTAFYNKTTQSWMCPPLWDSILCWPHTPAEEIASIPCPLYIAGFRENYNATRACTENGSWFVSNKTHQPWGDYTACAEGLTTTIFTNLTSSKSDVLEKYEILVPIIKIISQTGYAISLISLIVAFSIMVPIRKLHCARNILHMNLFASFMLRAFFHILKEILFIEGTGLGIDFSERDGDLYFKTDFKANNYQCKILTSLLHYFTTANFSWILTEGLYLSYLVWRALFADSSRHLTYFICLGWGLPICVLVPWIIARILFNDTMCWTTNDNSNTYLIIVIPTVLAVVINLVLFCFISVVLYRKLRSPICEDTKRYVRWAKSTLLLVPLFGVHYAILLLLYVKMDIWLIFDSILGSFQGLSVAILYCFMNEEVKTEVKPYIYNFLSYVATHEIFGKCFPCREKFLRSAVGSHSVCTTLSYSSVYFNGVGHRNSKSKYLEKEKHSLHERGHSCNGIKLEKMNGIHNGAKYNSSHNGQEQVETCLSTEQPRDKGLESSTTDEEICMLTKNC